MLNPSFAIIANVTKVDNFEYSKTKICKYKFNCQLNVTNLTAKLNCIITVSNIYMIKLKHLRTFLFLKIILLLESVMQNNSNQSSIYMNKLLSKS